MTKGCTLNSVKKRGSRGALRSTKNPQRYRVAFTLEKQRERGGAFTLLELLIVVGIIGLLLVLIGPAFTTIKGGTDVTSAAYTVKGVLDTARTYAISNDTYTWVGFYEEDVSQPSISHGRDPCTGCVGRLVMSTVASKDRTTIYVDPNNPADIDSTRLIQVGKLTKIDNVHAWTHTDNPGGTGATFDYRPNVRSICIGDLASPPYSATPFQYPVGNGPPSPQYIFRKAVQFSPTGEVRINNNASTLQPTAEIALQPTHGATVPGSVPANSAAIQFTGIGGNVRVYRR